MQPMKVLVASEGHHVAISTNIHVRQNNFMTGGNTAKYAGGCKSREMEGVGPWNIFT
jgi:hypothetical protein